MISVFNIVAVCIKHGVVAPCVVYIFYHNCACVVKNGNDIALHILAVEVLRIVMYKPYYALSDLFYKK